jgi:NTE family protein
MSFEGIVVPIAALEGAPLFEGLGPEELTSVASLMRFRSFKAGDVICREGERGESMFIVVDGLVHLVAALAEMPAVRTRSIFDEGRLVGKLRRGDAVGTGSLLTGEPRSATAKAAVDTDVLELGREEFGAVLGRFPQLFENLTRILTRRLAEATSGQARGRTRGEAVALIAGASLQENVPDVVAAAISASPGGIASLDARESMVAALERLDGLLRDNTAVVVTAALDQEDLPQLLREVDRAVGLIGSGEEARRLGVLALEHGVKGQPVEVVLCGEARPDELAVDAVRVVRARGGDLTGDGAAWVGRHLSRTKLGLALGAGGAKGYAHVGVLHVLQDAGYTVDYVSGSSIGAVVGAWLALGLDAAAIEAAMRETFTPETVAETLKISFAGGASGLDAMIEVLRSIAGERTFADCEIPLAIMTADLTDRVPAPLRTGTLWEALVAATALAGVFPPHELSGHRLVDGLAIDPVPTRAVIEDGADVTVAVNLIPRVELPAWPGQPAPAPQEPRRRGSRMLDTLLEVMDLSQLDTSEQGAGLADIAITPRFGPGSWRDFHLADLYLAAGREAAVQRLPALRSLATPQLAGATT